MTILGRLLSRRTLSYQQVFGTGGDTVDLSGVSPRSAAGLVAFMSAVRLLTDDIATLPVGAFVKLNGQAYPVYPKPEWIESPIPNNPNMTRASHISDLVASLLFDGNFFTYCLPDVYSAQEITVLRPSTVEVRGTESRPIYRVHGATTVDLGPEQIVHVPLVRVPGELRGLSFIESARRTIRAGLSVEEFAGNFFARGLAPGAVLKMPAGVKVSKEEAKDYADQFEERHAGAGKAHRVAVIDQGASLEAWTITPEQAQFIETRLANVEEIARLFRIPPPMLGINSPGAVSYASVEQQSINYVVHTIRPYLERIEQAYSRLLPRRPDGTQPYIKFNVAGLLRGDLKSRYEAYNLGVMAGFLTYDDVRKLEDLAPLEGGDRQRVPLTHADREVAELQQRVTVYGNLIGTYTPAEAAKIAGLPAPKGA